MPGSFQCVLYISLFKQPHMKLNLEMEKKEHVKNARDKFVWSLFQRFAGGFSSALLTFKGFEFNFQESDEIN